MSLNNIHLKKSEIAAPWQETQKVNEKVLMYCSAIIGSVQYRKDHSLHVEIYFQIMSHVCEE